MMGAFKRHALQLLAGLNALLLCILVACWVTPSGALRGTTWAAPAPRLTDFASQLPTLPGPMPADIASFVGLLERPLFSPTRRPPAATSQGAPEAKVDNLSTAKLTGIFNSPGASGLIMRMGDKDMRVQLHQSLDGWTLKSLTDREATFASGGQTRVLQLKRADVSQAAPGSPAASAAAGAAPRRLPFLPPPVSVPAPHPERAEAATSAVPSSASNGPSSGGGAGEGAPAASSAPRAVFGGTRR